MSLKKPRRSPKLFTKRRWEKEEDEEERETTNRREGVMKGEKPKRSGAGKWIELRKKGKKGPE